MSLIDWLLGGRSRVPEPPAVQHLFAAAGVGGVLYADGRLLSWRLDSGEPVHDTRVTGPRVAWDGEALVDSQPEGFHGLPFWVRGRLLQVGKGELRFGDRVVEQPWLEPSSLLSVAVSPSGRVALLDPFSNRPALLGPSGLARLAERELPVMGGCFDGEDLLVLREGAIERYDAAGSLAERTRPHALQTLVVTPGGTLGLDRDEQLEVLLGERQERFGPAPEAPSLSTERGLLVSTRGGFNVDGTPVELRHQGLLDTDQGVLAASWPPSLYDRAGRCLHTFTTPAG